MESCNVNCEHVNSIYSVYMSITEWWNIYTYMYMVVCVYTCLHRNQIKLIYNNLSL